MVRVANVLLAIVVVVAVTMLASPVAAEPSGDLVHRPPSDAAIIDHFRPPPERWSSGNRGVDFGTAAGDEIHASAPGRVVFAGEVGGQLHVTIEHSDGLRTSYSFVADIRVAVGGRVRGGELVAIAGGAFHFGVRAPDGTYLDPEALFAGRLRARVLLVPGTEQGRDALGSERAALWSTLLEAGPAALSAMARTATDAASIIASFATELEPATHLSRLVAATVDWFATSDECTESSAPTPVPGRGRVVVLVSGLGTASESNSAWEFDTSALGYDDSDVVRYSYAGGRAPGSGSASQGITERAFTSIDSQQSISVSADRLATLVGSIAAQRPGVPIDVLAHSQGGIVARLGIERAAASGRLPGEVGNLVTVGTPHRGAPLAAGVRALGASSGGAATLTEVRASGAAGPLDDRRPAFAQLAPGSTVQSELHDRPLPDSVRFTAIGAAGDLIVPGTTALDPAADVSVLLPSPIGTEAHGELPSRPDTTREVALALSGAAPGCRSLTDTVTTTARAETVRWGEAVLGAGAALAGLGLTGAG